jgi:hypothetical protein
MHGNRTPVACIFTEYITLNKCFWEELTLGQTIRKNGEIIENCLITLSVGLHLIVSYGFWRHTNNAIGKKVYS